MTAHTQIALADQFGWWISPIQSLRDKEPPQDKWNQSGENGRRKTIPVERCIHYYNGGHSIIAGMSDGFFVLDIDGPEEEAKVAELLGPLDSLPTWQTSTPRGGRHIYLRGAVSSGNSNTGLGPRADTRGWDGNHPGYYIILCGWSKQGEYVWNGVSDIMEAPEALLDLLPPRYRPQHVDGSAGMRVWSPEHGINAPVSAVAALFSLEDRGPHGHQGNCPVCLIPERWSFYFYANPENPAKTVGGCRKEPGQEHFREIRRVVEERLGVIPTERAWEEEFQKVMMDRMRQEDNPGKKLEEKLEARREQQLKDVQEFQEAMILAEPVRDQYLYVRGGGSRNYFYIPDRCFTVEKSLRIDLQNAGLAPKQVSRYLSLIPYQIRVVTHVDYVPGVEGMMENGGYSLWKGPDYGPIDPEKYPLVRNDILNFFDWLFPDDYHRNFVICWCAYLTQNPGKKVNWMLILYSKMKGVGKTLFFSIMEACLGEWNVLKAQPATISKSWTDWASGFQLVVFEDVREEGESRSKVMTRLAPIITNPTISIDQKGKDIRRSRNYINVAVATNFPDNFTVTKEERRIYDPPVTEDSMDIEMPGWGKAFQDALEQYPAEVRHFFLTEVVVDPEFLKHVHAQPPMTTTRQSQIVMHESDFEDIREFIHSEKIKFVTEEFIDRKTLYALLKEKDEREWPPARTKKMLQEYGYILMDPMKIDGKIRLIFCKDLKIKLREEGIENLRFRVQKSFKGLPEEDIFSIINTLNEIT